MTHGIENYPIIRLRRLRQHPALRNLVRETHLTVNDLILPLFIKAGEKIKKPIASMPGHYQFSVDQLDKEIAEIVKLNIPGVMLFGIPSVKNELGTDSFHPQGIVQQAIRRIKALAPDLLIVTDCCFCEYTDHGHCGVVHQQAGKWDVDNDATLELLARQAVSHAEAGADMVAPSGMMDGMVSAIREGLDGAGFQHIPILSYAAKYLSAFYGPFREAAESAPRYGNRQTYQMDPANGQEALRETWLDLQEGADILMIKPALAYLDIIYRVKQANPGVPIAAYQVSGEFAMIKAAVANDWLAERQVVLEVLTSIKRAGADFIFTYFAKQVAQWLQAANGDITQISAPVLQADLATAVSDEFLAKMLMTKLEV